jgi:hypothetical protein
MSFYDWAIAITVAASMTTAVVAVGYAIQQRRQRQAEQHRAEMAEMWAEEYQRQACDFQQQIAGLERQRDNLRMLYASLVRERLAWSMPIVEYYARRKAK